MAFDHRKYFPLIKGLKLTYRGEAPGDPISTSTFEIIDVKKMWPNTVADCKSDWTMGNESGTREFKVIQDDRGIFQDGAMELRLPIVEGDSWDGIDGHCTVDSLEAMVEIPAGEFTQCLRVTYLIAGGDAGWGEKIYAPGIGLVRQGHSDEASPWKRDLVEHNSRYDVFIAHASEDKEQLVRPLVEELRKRGLLVWYDEYALNIGDSLEETIKQGIQNATYGVAVLSPNFFRKQWPQNELDWMITGNKTLLPVVHEMTFEVAAVKLPALRDRVAEPTSVGLERLAERIEHAVLR